MNKLLIYQIVIFSTLYFGYGFYIFTRKSMSYIIPHMDKSMNITKNDIGFTISAQNFAYALSKFFSGILADVASCRVLFGGGLFVSGLLNIGLNKGLKTPSLYSISFLLGLAQGPSWPCCGKILQNWIPKSKFATAWSVLSTSANVAGAIGPFLATTIAVKYHWSYGFMIPGCISMTVGYLSILLLKNKPSDVGLSDYHNQKENQQKEDSDGDEDENGNKKKFSRFQQMRLMLTYPYFLALCLCYFTSQLVKTLFSDWSQLYMIKSIKIDSFTASNFVTAFEIAGIASSFVSGLVADLMITKKQAKKKEQQKQATNTNNSSSRVNLLCVYLVLLVVAMYLFIYHVQTKTHSLQVLLIGALAGFSVYGPITLIGVMAMEFTPKNLSGTSHGIVTLAANIGAIFAGLPFSLLSKYYSWKFSFQCVNVFNVLTLVILFICRNFTSKYQIETTNESKKQK